jgi:predicted permease
LYDIRTALATLFGSFGRYSAQTVVECIEVKVGERLSFLFLRRNKAHSGIRTALARLLGSGGRYSAQIVVE